MRDGQGNLKGKRTTRHFAISLLLTKYLKTVARSGYKHSLVVREAVVDESVDWRCKAGRTDGVLHRSDIKVTTAEIDTHYDLVITTPQVYGTAALAGCSSIPGVAAKAKYNQKLKFYNDRYTFPERRLVPIAIEIHGRWHPDSRKAIKEMMRIELSDGDVVDNETLSYQTSHLLKATTVALARERALALLRLAKNLREFHHEHGDALTQVQEDDEE